MSRFARYRRALRDRWLAVRLGLVGRQHQYGEIVALRRMVAHFGIDCVIDVGANAGQYATMLRHDVGFRGTILSFEPNPGVCRELEKVASKDGNWHVYNMALSDRDGEAEFHIMAADQFSSLNVPGQGLEPIFADRTAVTSTVHVPCARLDRLWPDLAPAKEAKAILLKMDTQGHDAQVCSGASKVLGEMVGVQTELAVRPLYAGATDFRTMIALLGEAGFVPNAMFANNKGHFPLLVELDGLFVRADLTLGGNVPII
ncbi:MAG: FkbM family methyltransferase [Sphingomonadales bacterium]|nr:FkbM family methyltransferase [Sphingomonadales bacterium]